VSDRYHARVTSDGRLFIAETVLDESAVIDRRTGALIDVPTDSVRLQNVPINHAFNFCDEAACRASVEFGSFRLPVAVTYHCNVLGGVEVALVGVVVRVDRSPDQANTGCQFESGAMVPAGELLGAPGFYQLSARTPDENPLSVSVTEGGTLVIGHFQRNAACPCVPGGR
jgi:hypothetical protein